MRYVRLFFWLFTALYWTALCVATHVPARALPHVGVGDKVQHLLSYAGLAGLIGLTMWVNFPRRRWLVWAVLVVGLVYGAVDEQTQKLVGRTCDLDDWIADAVGTIAGILPVALLQRFVRLDDPGRTGTEAASDPATISPELAAALDVFDGAGPAR